PRSEGAAASGGPNRPKGRTDSRPSDYRRPVARVAPERAADREDRGPDPRRREREALFPRQFARPGPPSPSGRRLGRHGRGPSKVRGRGPKGRCVGALRLIVRRTHGKGVCQRGGIVGAELFACNTDAQHLLHIASPKKGLLGRRITKGLGAGALPQIGEEAAREAEEELRAIVQGSDIVFVTCGLGGGTGTGSC